MEKLHKEIAEWSDKTFGTKQIERIFAVIKHMEKEVKELRENPTDIEEYADVFMLLLDACRLVGFSFEDLKKATKYKLDINKSRKWGNPDKDGVIEHIKENKK